MDDWKTGACPPGEMLISYVRGELTPDERFRVEDHLLDCPLCESTVAAFIEQGIPDAAQVERLNSPPAATFKTRIRRLWPYLTAAATILFLLIAYWGFRQGTYHERLFVKYFNPQPRYGYEQQRAATAPNNRRNEVVLDQAITYHEQKQYELSLIAWRAYLAFDGLPNDFRPYLYAATAALATGNDEEAAYFLDQLPPNAKDAFGEEVHWYRSLLSLKQNGPSEAVLEQLEQLQKMNRSIYSRELAPNLLEDLSLSAN